jgi:DNA-binding NarL/FixJ family response regulator
MEGLLTSRQEEVALLTCRGLMDKEIARDLDVSLQTVRNHQKGIKVRCGVGNRTSLVIFMLTGWLPTGACCETRCMASERRGYRLRRAA